MAEATCPAVSPAELRELEEREALLERLYAAEQRCRVLEAEAALHLRLVEHDAALASRCHAARHHSPRF